MHGAYFLWWDNVTIRENSIPLGVNMDQYQITFIKCKQWLNLLFDVCRVIQMWDGHQEKC